GASQRALEAAGRLAADRGAEVTVIMALEVPFDLPLDALLDDEEGEARELLRDAQAAVERFGVDTSTRLLRARDAAEAILEVAAERDADLIVLGARRGRSSLGRAALAILKGATCRVLVVVMPA